MEYRGLSTASCQMLESVPGLRALLEHVCNDPSCCIEVRHNYLNCYYRGGSLFKMKFKPMSKQLEFKFDSKYFELKKSPHAAYEDLKAWNDSNPSDPKKWLERLEELKQTMDAWLSEHEKPERETQQKIVKLNTFTHGNYQSIDIELAIPKNQKAGRMDIIAVRREGERYVPVIVELKHGKDSFYGKSGIKEHYRKITEFLDNEDGEPYLIETIRRIWTAKKTLGLLEEPVPDATMFERAELLFAVTCWKDGDGAAEEIRKQLQLSKAPSRTFRIAISHTTELYFDNGVTL